MTGAARVFAEYGYAAGTTDRIAAAAGLSIGSLYQYFPNKDAILVVLAQAHLEQTAEAVEACLSRPRPAREWLPELTSAVIRLHADNPRLHQVLFEEAPRPPQLLARFRQVEQDAVETAAALLRSDPEMHVDQPELAARMVLATIESLTHRFTSRSHHLDTAHLTNQIVTMTTAYLQTCRTPR
ncbi:TetR/AcrR family transcriptional regulator [Streptomyces iconiensis]|uniref:TetR/AcrR family transcriptional regulator n=1 Tax=Streptomyces iconiensis TaxID=1384038 RepID=A0ABT6ZYN6_9ACTN|nr:TetR/AcrR family transcriptional regulator [Streptomyces iconiensis]MDJ1134179.1 TetR/AcrR family transcriptional regulator [Streptomyces iconiensis]